MKNTSKIVLAIVCLMIVLVFCLVIQITRVKIKADTAVQTFKQQFKMQSLDNIKPCVYDAQIVIINLNHRYYFSVKSNIVKLLELMHHKENNIFPEIARDQDFMDLMWLLEKCN